MLKLEELFKIEKPQKQLSKRADLISQIYEIYSSQTQKDFRKRENWKRYISWLKANRIDEKLLGQKKTIALWKRKGLKEYKFIKEFNPKQLAIMLAPFNEKNGNIDALYYFISMGKDMDNRRQNFGGYIMSHLFSNEKTQTNPQM